MTVTECRTRKSKSENRLQHLENQSKKKCQYSNFILIQKLKLINLEITKISWSSRIAESVNNPTRIEVFIEKFLVFVSCRNFDKSLPSNVITTNT